MIKQYNMEKKQKMMTMKVTKEEEELLAAIRNYVKSFPNGDPELRWYAEKLFDIMMDAYRF